MRAVCKVAAAAVVLLCCGVLGSRGAAAQDWAVADQGWTRGLLALPGGELASMSGGTVKRWVVGAPAPAATFKVCWGEEVVPAGVGQVALGCSEGLQLLNLKTGKTRWAARWKHPKIDGIAASDDGSRVVVLAGGQVYGFSGARLKPEAPWAVPEGEGREVAISGDGRVVVVSGEGGLWRWEEGGAPVLLPGTSRLKHPTLDTAGERVVAEGPGAFEATLRDARSGALLEVWRVGSWLSDAAFLPDGRVGLAGSDGARIGGPGGGVQEVGGGRGAAERVVYLRETGQVCTGDRSGSLRCAALPAAAPQAAPGEVAAGGAAVLVPEPPSPEGELATTGGEVKGEEALSPALEDSGGLSGEESLLSLAVLLGGATLGGVPLLALEEDVGIGESLLLGGVASVGMAGMVGGVVLCWLGLELMSSATELINDSNPVVVVLGAMVFIVLWPVGFVLSVSGAVMAVGGPVWTGLGLVAVDTWVGAEPEGLWTPALAAGGGGLLGAGLGFGLSVALELETEESVWLMIGLGTVGATLTYALVREPEGQGGAPMMVLTPPLSF